MTTGIQQGESKMIYQKTTEKNNQDYRDKYRIAVSTIEFTNRYGEVFTIETGTVFTVSADYTDASGEYEVVIRSYEFGNVIIPSMASPEHDSPLTVQTKISQRLFENNYSVLKKEIEKNSVTRDRRAFELSITGHQDVRNFSYELMKLRDEHRKTEREADGYRDELDAGAESVPEQFINSVFTVFESFSRFIEDSPVKMTLFRIANITVFAALSMGMLIRFGSSNVPANGIALFFLILLDFWCFMNIFFRPETAPDIFKAVLKLPFRILRVMFPSASDERRKLLKILYDDTVKRLTDNESLQIRLKKALDSKFETVIREITDSAGSSDENNDIESIAVPELPFHRKSAAQITETETRTDEEIRGGCSRVMYPVYSTEHNAGSPDHKASESSGTRKTETSGNDNKPVRNIISLTKPGRKDSPAPAGKKVDLTKK